MARVIEIEQPEEKMAIAKIRAFYDAMGFRPVEVFPTLWDVSNPCLMMMKYIE